MGLKTKGDIEPNPQIPEDYYLSQVSQIRSYERNDREALGVLFRFRVKVDDDSEVRLPFFAPAKLSVSAERESSRLARNLQNLGLLEPVLNELGVKEEIMSEQHKWIAETQDEFEELRSVLDAVFKGKNVRVNVEDDQDGDESQISKFSKLFDEDSVEEQGSSDDSDSGDDDSVILSDEGEAEA